jgi:ring-1,2-phenylacetyl-CoA epoxidase subunit PaaB
MKEGKAFEHTGIVHAATSDMAFLFAKEQFSRRYTCTGMWVVASDRVWVAAYTELEENTYDHIGQPPDKEESSQDDFDVFHLYKRGKQHKHVGQVIAKDTPQALLKAKVAFDTGKPVLNIWLIKSVDIQATTTEDQEIWSTLKEKTHREVISYRAGDKLTKFKERHGEE